MKASPDIALLQDTQLIKLLEGGLNLFIIFLNIALKASTESTNIAIMIPIPNKLPTILFMCSNMTFLQLCNQSRTVYQTEVQFSIKKCMDVGE
ncbi:hypothetical protein C0Q44_19355 [Paenibacillus sp. PCH8]|nr:hypothetical protein C0Q44_19355 [Paenibacillus sp. PCH8]